MPRKPRKGTMLQLSAKAQAQPEFIANHGYLYTMVGAYPSVSMSGDLYRVRSIASGNIVHMYSFELEKHKEKNDGQA